MRVILSDVKRPAMKWWEIWISSKYYHWNLQTEDRNKLWTARHKLYYASLALRPGCRSVITDVCVPISLLPEMIDATQKDFQEAGIVGRFSLFYMLYHAACQDHYSYPQSFLSQNYCWSLFYVDLLCCPDFTLQTLRFKLICLMSADAQILPFKMNCFDVSY